MSLVDSVLLRRLRVRLRGLSLFQRRLTAAPGMVAQCLHAFRDQHRPTPQRNRRKLSAGYRGAHPSWCRSWNKFGHDGGETAANAAKSLSLQRSRLCARLRPPLHHLFSKFQERGAALSVASKSASESRLSTCRKTHGDTGGPSGGKKREKANGTRYDRICS